MFAGNCEKVKSARAPALSPMGLRGDPWERGRPGGLYHGVRLLDEGSLGAYTHRAICQDKTSSAIRSSWA